MVVESDITFDGRNTDNQLAIGGGNSDVEKSCIDIGYAAEDAQIRIDVPFEKLGAIILLRAHDCEDVLIRVRRCERVRHVEDVEGNEEFRRDRIFDANFVLLVAVRRQKLTGIRGAGRSLFALLDTLRIELESKLCL
jgi:hypothetical protein